MQAPKSIFLTRAETHHARRDWFRAAPMRERTAIEGGAQPILRLRPHAPLPGRKQRMKTEPLLT